VSRVAALLPVLRIDALRVARDRFLISLLVYLLGVSAAMRWILPSVARALRSRSGFDLEPLYPLLVSYFAVVLGALAVGVVGGMLLLEIREDRTVRALLVSPLPLRAYVAGYSTVLALLAAAVTAGEAAVIGLGLPPWRALVPVALIGGLAAPAISLYLATFAGNKIEAFAQMKLVGTAGLLPIGAWLLPLPWQYAACVFPPFWAVKAWWLAESGSPAWAGWLVGGAILSSAVLRALTRRFNAASRSSG
jgi:fluoroquinolone transport system permease protein